MYTNTELLQPLAPSIIQIMRAFLTILPKFQFAEEAFDWENDSIGFYNKYASLFGFIGLMYLPMVFGLKHYMHTREPLDLKGVLIVWNLLLAVLSAYGAYFTVPQGWKFIQDNGFVEGICDTNCYVHPYAVIILLFNLSKMAEFVDTILLRFRKKPVIFLHWYHHILTMFYCWYGNVVGSLFNCTGWYFAAMNLSVHSIMYSYYALAAMGYGRAMAKSGLNKIITTIQITQMFGGIGIIFMSTHCDRIDNHGLVLATVMYVSYLFLFAKLFYDKYAAPRLSKTIAALKKRQGLAISRLKESHIIATNRLVEDHHLALKRALEDELLLSNSDRAARGGVGLKKNK